MNLKVDNKRNIIIGFAIIAASIMADQLTKFIITYKYSYLQKDIVMIIEDFLYISHVRNTGAAWSIFQGNTFVLIWLTGFILILTYLFMFYTDRISLTIPIAMIAGGGTGNMIDRIFRNAGVVDFIDVYIFGYDFPVFNVADITLVCGTILLCIYTLFLYKDDNPGFKKLLERRLFRWMK